MINRAPLTAEKGKTQSGVSCLNEGLLRDFCAAEKPPQQRCTLKARVTQISRVRGGPVDVETIEQVIHTLSLIVPSLSRWPAE